MNNTATNWLRQRDEGVLLQIKLQPRASRNEIIGESSGELRVRVTAPPVDSAANEALLRLLAEKLDCPRGKIELIRGGTSRHKLVLLRGATVESIAARLLA